MQKGQCHHLCISDRASSTNVLISKGRCSNSMQLLAMGSVVEMTRESMINVVKGRQAQIISFSLPAEVN